MLRMHDHHHVPDRLLGSNPNCFETHLKTLDCHRQTMTRNKSFPQPADGMQVRPMVIANPKIELEVAVTFNEVECRALEAFSGYSEDETVKVFYAHLGEAYMKPHEAGFRTALKKFRAFSEILRRMNKARNAFQLPP